MRKTFHIVPCRGTSKKTGKRVGSRHRWNGSTVCVWCDRFKDQVRVEDAVPAAAGVT